ncbi:translocator protein-like [Cyprinus carpio]|uniref:Translocator protein-like n=1 Tax=Cyprinus carpio TaxID=7962 RepID=A0A9Q9Y6L0_CYPCA|nr:translocator protein-like [Cyprinus carpio]
MFTCLSLVASVSVVLYSCTPTVCYTNLYHDFKITPVIEGHRGVSLLQTASNSASTCRFRMWIPMLSLTALPHVGGIFGGLITRREVKTWYTTLNKPSWRPPNAAFPVVWTTLYTGMGYGSYLVWKELGGFTQDALVPLGLYGMQLALNWAWTPIFFGAHNIKLAMIELVMLTGTVAATMVSWYPISRTATLLMVPYLAWLCLANSLNYCIWRDNPDPKKDD